MRKASDKLPKNLEAYLLGISKFAQDVGVLEECPVTLDNGFCLPELSQKQQIGSEILTAIPSQSDSKRFLANWNTLPISDRRFLLLGDGGQGKSAVLKFWIQHLSEEFLKCRNKSLHIPVYIEARELWSKHHSPDVKLTKESVASASKTYNSVSPSDFIDDHPCAFFIDQFEDIPGTDLKSFSKKFLDFLDHTSGFPIIIASRSDFEFSMVTRLQVLQIEPLRDDTQRNQLITHLFSNSLISPRVVIEKLSGITAILENRFFLSAAALDLRMSWNCEATISLNMIFEKLLHRVISKHASTLDPMGTIGFKACSAIAYQLFSESKVDISIDEVFKVFKTAPFLYSFLQDHHLEKDRFAQFIFEFFKRSELFKETSPNYFRFKHDTFLEFFIARHLFDYQELESVLYHASNFGRRDWVCIFYSGFEINHERLFRNLLNPLFESSEYRNHALCLKLLEFINEIIIDHAFSESLIGKAVFLSEKLIIDPRKLVKLPLWLQQIYFSHYLDFLLSDYCNNVVGCAVALRSLINADSSRKGALFDFFRTKAIHSIESKNSELMQRILFMAPICIEDELFFPLYSDLCRRMSDSLSLNPYDEFCISINLWLVISRYSSFNSTEEFFRTIKNVEVSTSRVISHLNAVTSYELKAGICYFEFLKCAKKITPSCLNDFNNTTIHYLLLQRKLFPNDIPLEEYVTENIYRKFNSFPLELDANIHYDDSNHEYLHLQNFSAEYLYRGAVFGDGREYEEYEQSVQQDVEEKFKALHNLPIISERHPLWKTIHGPTYIYELSEYELEQRLRDLPVFRFLFSQPAFNNIFQSARSFLLKEAGAVPFVIIHPLAEGLIHFWDIKLIDYLIKERTASITDLDSCSFIISKSAEKTYDTMSDALGLLSKSHANKKLTDIALWESRKDERNDIKGQKQEFKRTIVSAMKNGAYGDLLLKIGFSDPITRMANWSEAGHITFHFNGNYIFQFALTN